MSLQVIEHEARRVLTTSQIAESFGVDSKLISRNFQRNQERYEVGTHYFVLAGEDLKAFKAARQKDDSLKYVSVLYLWTELGAWMHAKSLNNERAWAAYRTLIDSYYTLSNHVQEGGDNLTLALPEPVAAVIEKIEGRLIVLEKQIQLSTLHTGEQKRLRNAVAERVHELSRQEPGARPALFRAVYRTIKEKYEVESYRDVKQCDLQDALRFVAGWGGELHEKRS